MATRKSKKGQIKSKATRISSKGKLKVKLEEDITLKDVQNVVKELEEMGGGMNTSISDEQKIAKKLGIDDFVVSDITNKWEEGKGTLEIFKAVKKSDSDKMAKGGEITDKKIDEVLKHYMIAALWSTPDSDEERGEYLDANFDLEDFSPEAKAKMREDVKEFLEENKDLLEESKLSDDQIGHDFWLTRHHHGAGFWDRGLGEVGKKLTKATNEFKESYVEVGDDNKVHVLKHGGKMAKGGKAQKKVAKVMREFKHGKLKSSSGKKVTDRDQAIAIALSEAREVNPNYQKKAKGGELGYRSAKGFGKDPRLEGISREDLDRKEKVTYDSLKKAGHGAALQSIINSVEGNYSTLSPMLKKVAMEQEKELQSQMKNGGKSDKIYLSKEEIIEAWDKESYGDIDNDLAVIFKLLEKKYGDSKDEEIQNALGDIGGSAGLYFSGWEGSVSIEEGLDSNGKEIEEDWKEASAQRKVDIVQSFIKFLNPYIHNNGEMAKGGKAGNLKVKSVEKYVMNSNTGKTIDYDKFISLQEADDFAGETSLSANKVREILEEAGWEQENLDDLKNMDVDEIAEYMREKDLMKCDNTYNYSYFGNAIVMCSYKLDKDKQLVFFAMHISGDVRGNYKPFKAYVIDHIEEHPFYNWKLYVDVNTNKGTITLDGDGSEAYYFTVGRDETGTWEENEYIKYDDIKEKLGVDIWMEKGGRAGKYEDGGVTEGDSKTGVLSKEERIARNKEWRKQRNEEEKKKIEERWKTGKAKSRVVYFVQGNYGSGWDDLTAHDTRYDAIQDWKDYQANENSPHRIISRRVGRADYEKGNFECGGKFAKGGKTSKGKNKRKQIEYGKLVGRRDDDYYFLDYVFDDGDGFKGAVASVLRPIPKEEYDERMSLEGVKERFSDIWRENVRGGHTEASLEDWAQELLDMDGENAVFDTSFSKYWDDLREEAKLSEKEYPIIEGVGGGRSFSKNMHFDEVYNPELIKVINQYEKAEKKEQGGEAGKTSEGNLYYIVVDQDERGEYRATVYDVNEKEVWDVDTDTVRELQEDGYLKYKPHEDLEKLSWYLGHIGIIPKRGNVVSEREFEKLKEKDEYKRGGKIWKSLDFENIEQYYDYIDESRVNGNFSQVRELVKKMDEQQTRGFFKYAREMGYNETINWINEKMERGGKTHNRIPDGTTIEYKGENYYILNGVRNYEGEYVYQIRNYRTGKTETVISDEFVVNKNSSMAHGGKIKQIMKKYDVEATPTYSDKTRYQIVTPYFNTLTEINRKEFGGSGIIEKYGNTSSYVLYTPNIYAEGGEIGNWYKEGSDKWGLEKSETYIKENNGVYDVFVRDFNTKENKWEFRKRSFDSLEEAKKYGYENEIYSSGGSTKELTTEQKLIKRKGATEQHIKDLGKFQLAERLSPANTPGKDFNANQIRNILYKYIPDYKGKYTGRYQVREEGGSTMENGGGVKSKIIVEYGDGKQASYTTVLDDKISIAKEVFGKYPDWINFVWKGKVYSKENIIGSMESGGQYAEGGEIIQEIIARKKQGTDSTEAESAEIKGWLRETLIQPGTGDVQIVEEIQTHFPQEYGEVLDEMENNFAKGGSVELFDKIKTSGVISEQEINLIKNRMNNNRLDEKGKELVQWIWDNKPELTKEQTKKGRDFLINLWKTPSGAERKNNPFGYREQDALENFESMQLAGFHDISRYGGREFYIPIYDVNGKDQYFQYYYDGKVNIIGKDGGKFAGGGTVKMYTVKIKHDKGIAKITTAASSEAAARKMVADAEGAPESAIISVTEKKEDGGELENRILSAKSKLRDAKSDTETAKEFASKAEEKAQSANRHVDRALDRLEGNELPFAKGGKITSEEKEFIEKELLESKGHTYRPKVLWGEEIVLKEKDGRPVKKFIVGNWESAERISRELNKRLSKKFCGGEMEVGGRMKEPSFDMWGEYSRTERVKFLESISMASKYADYEWHNLPAGIKQKFEKEAMTPTHTAGGKSLNDKKEKGGLASEAKAILQKQVQDLESLLSSDLTAEGIKESAKRGLDKIKGEIEKLERGDKIKKLKTQSTANKNVYIDIEKQFKQKMRNALNAEEIPYRSKSLNGTFRVFLSNDYQLDEVFKLYNDRRKKFGKEPVGKEVTGSLKKRGGKNKIVVTKTLKSKKPLVAPEKVRKSYKHKVKPELKRISNKAKLSEGEE